MTGQPPAPPVPNRPIARRFEGQVVFITGAARGQGRAEAIRFAAEGADVIALDICANLKSTAYPGPSREDLEETARLVRAEGARVVTAVADVRDLDSLERAVKEGVSTLGRLDVVIANAGMTTLGRAWEIGLDQWEETIGINLTGAFLTAKATIPVLIEQGSGGSIVFTSSVAGLRGLPLLSDYVAAKHGVTGLTKALANELGEYRIRVNSIHPFGVETGLKTGLGDWLGDDFKVNSMYVGILPDTMSEADDIAAAVAWIASNEARHITGVQLPVDLGRTTR